MFRRALKASASVRSPWPSKIGRGRNRQSSFFPKFGSDLNLCPVVTLEEYISKTRSLRKECSQLFISFIRPHGPVTSSTIARWLKEVLRNAGIDTEIFKAHSVRGASTSMAARLGVTVETILKAAEFRVCFPEILLQTYSYFRVCTSSVFLFFRKTTLQ